MQNSSSLPIDKVLPEIIATLQQHDCLILQAEPGAGKTTRVPLALLNKPFIDGKILLLEPRRVAARTAAHYMAKTLNEPVGQRIGYSMRNEQKTSKKTAIEVITEGLLVRRLLQDPELHGVSLIIFDEFHERSIHTDLGLALCRDASMLRDTPLKLLVMSATVDTAVLSAKLDNAPVINCSGRGFPVEIHKSPTAIKRFELISSIAKRCLNLDHIAGDTLVFLPGKAEVTALSRILDERWKETLNEGLLEHPTDLNSSETQALTCDIVHLYSGADEQRLESLFQPSAPGVRRFILATSIAQTSITLPYVNCVIDSGLERKPQYDLRTGITRLTTQRISSATATQRAGRAGRLRSGECYQLWTEQQHQRLEPYDMPEIGQIDLSETALSILDWGVKTPESLQWIDHPPHNLWQAALRKLESLGAIDPLQHTSDHPKFTALGKALIAIPAELRVARLLIEAKKIGTVELAASIAALISEPSRSQSTDIASCFDHRYRASLNRQQAKLAQRLEQLIKVSPQQGVVQPADLQQSLVELLLPAFSDWIAIATDTANGRYKLRNGTAVRLDPTDPLARHPMIVCIDIGGRDDRADLSLRLGLGITKQDVIQQLSHQLTRSEQIEWEGEHLRSVSVIRLGEIEIERKPSQGISKEVRVQAWCQRIQREGLDLLPQWQALTPWLARLRYINNCLELIDSLGPVDSPEPTNSLDKILSPDSMKDSERKKNQAWVNNRHKPAEQLAEIDLPDLSDIALIRRLDEWLAPALSEITRVDQLKQIALKPLLISLLPWQTPRWLDHWAPENLLAPSGRTLTINYQSEIPSVSIKLQEMFGLTQSPTTGFGQPIRIELLSPAARPVAMTTDMKHFWQNTYPIVRKELRGRYAKHPWPEDPLTATPSHLTNAAIRRQSE